MPEVNLSQKAVDTLRCEFKLFNADLASVSDLLRFHALQCESGFGPGRLGDSFEFWRSFCTDTVVLSTVKSGYKIPFIKKPNPFSKPNNRSALAHEGFVSEQLEHLLAQGLIREVSESDFINPLSVACNKDKLRLVLDCSFLNKVVAKFRFKIDDLSLALTYMTKGSKLIKYDLKSGYHHVHISNSDQKYLAFKWFHKGKTCTFVFTVLPFGLSTGPYIFTKLLRPLVERWRKNGIMNQIFIDDGLAIGNQDSLADAALNILRDLTKCGFVINVKKSVFFAYRCC